MENENPKVPSVEELLEEKSRIENELARKTVEAYKLKRIAEEGLSPHYLEFLKGENEEEFEQSLRLFKEERAKVEQKAKQELFANAPIFERTKTASPKELTEEDTIKQEILRLKNYKIF